MNQFCKKKHMISVLGIVIVLLGCTSLAQADETSINIVCTNSILADFTGNLLKENVSIEYIMPSGVCPAHFDTSPSDVSMIASADIVISLGWEPWLNSLFESSGNSDCEHIICAGLGEWNVLSGAKKYIEKLRDELSTLLPELNDTIHAKAQEYMTLVNETGEELQLMIVSKGYQDKSVICMEWQTDFTKWLGLNVTCSYAPPESLSTQDMLNVSNAAHTGEICAIIDNLQSGTDFGARIASESGAMHVIFTNFPGAIPGTDTYLDMITYNTEQIVNGISTYEYKQGEIARLEGDVSSLELQRNVSLFGVVLLVLLAGGFLVLYKKK